MSFRVSFMTSADIIEFMKNMALKSYSKLLKVMALLLVVMVVSYHSGLAGSALAHASELHEDEVEFAADEVSINREEGILIATGNVVLKQMGQILNADKIIYNQTTDIALANGNVVLTMPDLGAGSSLQSGWTFESPAVSCVVGAADCLPRVRRAGPSEEALALSGVMVTLRGTWKSSSRGVIAAPAATCTPRGFAATA